MKEALDLSLAPGRLAVCRLEPDAAVPPWVRGAFTAVIRSDAELTVVGDEDAVPADVRCENGFRRLVVTGPLDFSLVGILASIAVALAEAHVSIVALSTFDTDHVLVREADLSRAVETLGAAGHRVSPQPAGDPDPG